MSLLDDIVARVQGMTPAQRAEIEADALKATEGQRWTPSPGPQTQAYFSKADVLLFGGAAGGGKSQILLGLAFNEHRRSLIMRRQYTDLKALTEEAIVINGGRSGFNGSSPPSLRTADGRLLEFGAAAHAGDEMAWQGRAHDGIFIDEAAHFLESQILFLMGWLRSTEEGQRCRVVLASNPPMTAEGEWLTRWFAPWLEPTFPNPAMPGELRWAARLGDDLVWVDGPDPIDGVQPMSRTFIPSRLDDNPFLVGTNYRAVLQGLPAEMQARLLRGDFTAGQQDDERQVIPTAWIREAQDRWQPGPPKDVGMTVIGADVSGGGADRTILAPRYLGWYAPLEVVKDVTSTEGREIAAAIFKTRRNGCPVVIDMGGGFGGAPALLMSENDVPVVRFNGAEASSGQARDGSRLRFVNRRAEAWWRFREALDPSQEGGSIVQLPADPELRADLASPQFEVTSRGLKIESKDDIRDRLGRSPDRGDAVVMAWAEGEKALAAGLVGKTRGWQRPPTIVGHANIKRRR